MQISQWTNHCSAAFLILLLIGQPIIVSGAKPDLNDLTLPSGFTISWFHKGIKGARSLALGKQGTVFVSTRRRSGKIYALRDTNNDGIADQRFIIARGLNVPNGIAFYNNDLYVAEIHQIVRYPNIESRLNTPPEPIVVYDKLNNKRHHGWRYIAIKKGKLVIAVGAPCNVCSVDNTAEIRQINLSTLKTVALAQGVRNSVGFDWHPLTGQLWFTDNGRDFMGDTIPADELNVVTKNGQHFGFPICHGGTVLDPVFGKNKHCKNYTKPAWRFTAHAAPLGMRFYSGTMFPKKYQQQLFVAQHGSWNRSNKVGYNIMLLRLDKHHRTIISATPFITGWLKNEASTGRPVDLLVMPDGSILISDDKAGALYRVRYEAKK